MRQTVLEHAPGVRRAAAFGLVLVVPLAALQAFNDPFNVPKLGLLIAGVAVIGGIRAVEVLQGAGAGGLTRLWIPAVAILGPMLVSGALSPYRWWTLFGEYQYFLGVIPYLVIIAAGLLIADAFRNDGLPLAWAFTIAAGIVGGYAVLQRIGIDLATWRVEGAERPEAFVGSTIGNPNFTGGFLAIALPVAVALIVLVPRRRGEALTLTALIAGGWGVAMTQGGFGAGVAGVAVMGGFVAARRWRVAPFVGLALVAAIVAAMLGLVALSTARPDSRFASDTANQRGQWWLQSARMWQDAPVFGHGPNTHSVLGAQYRTLDDALRWDYGFSDDPHSVPMVFLSSTGALGLLGLAAVAAWALWRGFATARESVLHAAFAGGAVAYFVQALVSIDHVPLRLALWVCLAGLASDVAVKVKKTRRKQSVAPARRRRRARESLRAKPAVAAVGLVAVTAVAWAGAFVVADARVGHGRELFKRAEPDEARADFGFSLSVYPDNRYRHQYGALLGSAALAYEERGQSPLARELFGEMHAEFAFTDRIPDTVAMRDYARLLERWGEEVGSAALEDAAAQYERIVALDPLNALARVDLAGVLIGLDREEEAESILEDYVATVFDGRADVWGALALARAHLGEEQAAQTALERALALDATELHAVEARSMLEGDGS